MEQMGKTTEQHRAPKKKGTTTKEKKLMMRHQAWFARTTRACTEKEVESMFAIGTRNRTIEVPLRLHLSCQSATRTAINSTVDKRHALEMYVLHIQKLHKTQSADHQQKTSQAQQAQTARLHTYIQSDTPSSYKPRREGYQLEGCSHAGYVGNHMNWENERKESLFFHSVNLIKSVTSRLADLARHENQINTRGYK